MKLKNILKGYLTQYDIEEITIFREDKVLFSGKLKSFQTPKGSLLTFQQEIETPKLLNALNSDAKNYFSSYKLFNNLKLRGKKEWMIKRIYLIR